MLIAFMLAAAMISNFHDVEVVKVTDGDTFTVNIENQATVFGSRISVRILGIDTAELSDERQCARKAADESKLALAGLLKNSRVDLIDCQRDKYFRIGCRILLDGWLDVGETMLMMNLAIPYDGGTKPKWYCRRPQQ